MPLLCRVNISCLSLIVCAIFHSWFRRNVESIITHDPFDQIIRVCCLSPYQNIMCLSTCYSTFSMVIPQLTDSLVSCPLLKIVALLLRTLQVCQNKVNLLMYLLVWKVNIFIIKKWNHERGIICVIIIAVSFLAFKSWNRSKEGSIGAYVM